MRPSVFRAPLGVLLCLLLMLDAVGAAVAGVRDLGGCDHGQTANTAAMSADRHAPDAGHDAPAAAHHAGHAVAGPHEATATAHGPHGHDAHARHACLDAIGQAHQDAAVDADVDAPADHCDCDGGDCVCPAACSLVLASPAYPLPGTRTPGEMSAGPDQHAGPAPPQPDTLRPPIG